MNLTLGLATFPGLLNVADGAPVRALYRASMQPNAKLLEPLLSVLAAEGHDIGDLGRVHLGLNTERLDYYRRTAASLTAAVPTSTMVKGARIAHRYPHWLARGCVDLDMYVPDVEHLWTAATLVLSDCPAEEVNVSVCRRDTGHDVFVGISWKSPHSVLEPVYRVELATLPFAGDRHRLPSRPGLPAEPDLAQLLLVAEEQFQRPVIGRDIVDTAALLTAMADADPAGWAGEVDAWRLAPEMLALLAAVERHAVLPVDFVSPLREALAGYADAERARRETPVTEPDFEYGLLLSAARSAPTMQVEENDWGRVLACPLGTYLLVTDPDVDEDTYEMACAALGIAET